MPSELEPRRHATYKSQRTEAEIASDSLRTNNERFQSLEELEPHQRKTASVLFYSDFLDLLKKVGKNHAKNKKEKISLIRNLHELHFAGGLKNGELLHQWGGQSQEVYGIYENEVYEEAESLKEKYFADPKKYGVLSRIKIAVKVGRKLASREVLAEQKETLLNLSGYSKRDAVALVKKLGVSGVLGTSLGVVYWVSSGAAFAKGFSQPIFHDLDQTETAVILSGAYLANYGSSIINSIQNVRLLRNKNIENSPNLWATTTFLILNKLLSKKERREGIRDITTTLLTTGLPIYKEPAAAALAMSSEKGFSAVVLSHMAVGAVNLLQAAGDEVALKVLGKERGNKNKENKSS